MHSLRVTLGSIETNLGTLCWEYPNAIQGSNVSCASYEHYETTMITRAPNKFSRTGAQNTLIRHWQHRST